VLKETEKYVEKAIQLDRLNNNYLNELGSQKLSQEKFKEAIKCYNSALKLDESNAVSTLGILKCQILEDHIEDVGQQLELLSETQESVVSNPVIIIHLNKNSD
jgi:tetratricopeptide (TPR) repeat protein